MLSALRHWYHDWVTHDDRVLDRIFAGRALLTDDDFYQRYFADGSVSVVRVEIPQVVPARTGPLRHRIRLSREDRAFRRERRGLGESDGRRGEPQGLTLPDGDANLPPHSLYADTLSATVRAASVA